MTDASMRAMFRMTNAPKRSVAPIMKECNDMDNELLIFIGYLKL